jgi:glycosyltransferase involved in cell wall biosynthesis
MLSVLMATHNGADTIERTLAAMSAMDPPPGGWKLVVVNNASTDDTEACVLRWRDRLPLEYLVEPRLGKSTAMNTALKQAVGDLIVMTDDDVLPVRGWLCEWRRVADAYPQCAVFGGAIVPQFDAPPPPWRAVKTDFPILYGETLDYPEGRTEVADGNQLNVFGGNMAIRRSVYDQDWRFGETFLVGENGLMGEDSDFVQRLWASGVGVGFAPTARVGHIIHKEQVSWWWMQRRFFRHGRTMFMLDEVRHQDGRPQFRFPRWRIARALLLAAKAAWAAALMNRVRAFALSRALAYDLGALKQAWLLSRQSDARGR